MQVQRPKGFRGAWNKFMCLQGRHKVSIEDRMKLAEYEKDRFPSSCTKCGESLILTRDPFSSEEFFIEED